MLSNSEIVSSLTFCLFSVEMNEYLNGAIVLCLKLKHDWSSDISSVSVNIRSKAGMCKYIDIILLCVYEGMCHSTVYLPVIDIDARYLCTSVLLKLSRCIRLRFMGIDQVSASKISISCESMIVNPINLMRSAYL